jgi:CHASE3 domain sensor protein
VKPVLQDRTLAQQLSGAFVVFGAIVVGAILVTALVYGISRIWLTPEFERSRLAERAESAAHEAMLDEETGIRAYLLTRDVRFIEP